VVLVKREIFDKLHGICTRGEKHENCINRMIAICENDMSEINISDETKKKLFELTKMNDVDEALSMLIDKYNKLKEKIL
jgi:hypothetical protein